MKRIFFKRKTKLIFTVLLTILQLGSTILPVCAEEISGSEILAQEIQLYMQDSDYSNMSVQQAKEGAVDWLEEYVNQRLDTDDNIIDPFMYDACALLILEGKELDYDLLPDIESLDSGYNLDELCHIAYGKRDSQAYDEIWSRQNDDGGFGLTDEYTSDPYDTLLVLLTEGYIQKLDMKSRTNDDLIVDTATASQILSALQYICRNQNPDGGIGYTEQDQSRELLSAEWILISEQLGMQDHMELNAILEFCKNRFNGDFSPNEFRNQAELARVLFCEDCMDCAIDIEETLISLPEDNGSIYHDVEDTIIYILLMEEVERYHSLKLRIENMDCSADQYVLETGESENYITITTRFTYTVNQNIPVIIRYQVMENENIIFSEDYEINILQDDTYIEFEHMIPVIAVSGNEYYQNIQIIMQNADCEEEILMEKGWEYSLHTTEVRELTLESDIADGRDYQVYLSWTDMTTEDDRYGYRVFRQKEGQEWESRSSWDGEKVRVLNIYPSPAAKNYLVNWMTAPLTTENIPAGYDLFDISTVYIDDYNQNPNAYLMDENGKYLYDVLFFGTYNSNAYKDISDAAYEATQAYVNTGRGVLFGHDTISLCPPENHPNFAKFADQLGIKLLSYAHVPASTHVRVVNRGFLTSFPWNIEGDLTVPPTHTLGQLTGGSMTATVWMEMDGVSGSDLETGSLSNAYLFTKNQLAMIQTGHSNGQATDDERKVIANTLFYLKQLTQETSAVDHSFYDEEAPLITSVTEEPENGSVTIHALDRGTLYRYYVQAVNESAEKNIGLEEQGAVINSNIVEAEAVSNIQGYILGISYDTDPIEGLVSYDENGNLTSDVMQAENGILIYQPIIEENEEERYLHIYAVDHAGNVSEETVLKLSDIQASEPEPTMSYYDSPYALFASEDAVSISCCSANIRGDLYGDRQVFFQGSTLELTGTARTPGQLSIAGGILHLDGEEEGVEPITLPDYLDEITRDLYLSGETVQEISLYNSTEITTPTICEGTTGAWCPDLNMQESLLSSGSIRLNANTIHSGTDKKTILCSEEGDICIQATSFSGSGLIYAPNGTVTIQVSQFDYHGTIIADKIIIQAGYVNINQ